MTSTIQSHRYKVIERVAHRFINHIKVRQNSLTGYLFVFPAVIYLLVFLILPGVLILRNSFYQFDPAVGVVPDFTIDNYIRIVTEPLYLQTMLRTFRLGLEVTGILLFVGYPVAYFLARSKSRLIPLYMFIVISPLFVSVVIRSYGWMVILAKFGPLNRFFMAAGLIQEPLELLYTRSAVLIGMVHVLATFMILPLVSSLKGIDPNLVQAAENLGASRFHAFRTITLPLSMPGIVAGSVLVFTLSIAFFITPALLGSIQLQFLATLTYQQMMQIGDRPFASALSITMVSFTFFILFIVYRVFRVKVW